MTVWRRGFSEKCHQIVVALQVAYGGTMAAAIAMAVVAELR